jgi:hypothetical protein
MMESSDGYVGLQRAKNNEVVPSDLLEMAVPFVDVPANLVRNHKKRNPDSGLPRLRLHNMIAENHYQQLRKAVSNKKLGFIFYLTRITTWAFFALLWS